MGAMTTQQVPLQSMESKMEFSHIPVLCESVINGLNIRDKKTYVDCTIGGSGHALMMLEKANITLYGFDQDAEAIKVSKKRLEGKNAFLIKDNFKNAPKRLKELGVNSVAGVLCDLGVSSYQIDTPQRGFSFRFDSPLDMRMDQDATLDAQTVVNTYSESELKRVIKDYGEERFASSIAKKIVLSRSKEKILTTKQLEKIILSAVPRYRGNDGSSNVQRTFQAIRIEVNHELEGLDKFIREMTEMLEKGGRLAIISFHSLEDRIVKHTFKDLATGCICPPDLPVCVCGRKPVAKLVTTHPITASEEEIKSNRRSSSAKLRILEKL